MHLELSWQNSMRGRVHDGAVRKVLADEKEGLYCPVCHEKTNHFIRPTRDALNNEWSRSFAANRERPNLSFVFR